jgi:hypothetical protein
MADLITSAYAKRRINQASFTSGEDTTISELITAVSKAIRRYCRREFDSQSFDELYSGTGDYRLQLNQYPIVSVSQVATSSAGVPISDFEIDTARGWLTRLFGWDEGVDNYRVVYTAGYSTIPEDVQEACAEWVAALFWQTKENPAVYPDLPPAHVAFLLSSYRLLPV